jgi:hypothetical protein
VIVQDLIADFGDRLQSYRLLAEAFDLRAQGEPRRRNGVGTHGTPRGNIGAIS